MQLAYAEHQRGQTMIETVLMMPIALLALFALIYISRFGIVNERTYQAMRYAGVAAFTQGTNQAYTAADIYSNLAGGQQPVPCPTPPAGAFDGSAPYPGPGTIALFRPDSISIPACTTSFTDLGGASFLAARFISATSIGVNASVNVPGYLQPLIGSVTNTHATGAFVHSAYPGIILYCVAQAYDAVSQSLTAAGTLTLPTPGPGQPTAPPAPAGHAKC